AISRQCGRRVLGLGRSGTRSAVGIEGDGVARVRGALAGGRAVGAEGVGHTVDGDRQPGAIAWRDGVVRGEVDVVPAALVPSEAERFAALEEDRQMLAV